MKSSLNSLTLVLFLIVTGCAHANVVSFNKPEKTVTIQVNSIATENDAKKKADEYCGSGSSLLAMGNADTGAAYVGYGVYSKTSQRVFTFKCL